ncbi:L,D-transpeptidase [Mergibacter septicus]|uniref:L,D-transpeptidase n=1 Tax=Mergibacter septicus TaxID=221402 RepID=A0A8E3MGV0_9PAST|nr:L,D-transpeptidase family protein [Mergibacter septicus]AWX15711.1 L,D-transpeptidase [Mergibacter septicus]QDJ14964.1 L,D-transpeptidase [Mergibacter septicus]UTU47611.1 L,D-transpeptidase family protein [Mergibacter septicus]WMR96783.1 L,D-transpeptidase family protein [Mergibacter septicus]
MFPKKNYLLSGLFTGILSIALTFSFAKNILADENNNPNANVPKVDQNIELISNIPLLFPQKLVEIYSARQFQPIWQSSNSKKSFLKEYAILALANLNPMIAKHLNLINSSKEQLTQDLLLSDAFLTYLYYSTNVKKHAQTWLYLPNNYQVKVPEEKLIKRWLNAIKNNQLEHFIQQITNPNKIYQATLVKLIQLILDTNTPPQEIAKLAINLQRLRVIPNFEQGIFINIPSYQLYYYRDGKEVLTSKIIVGKLARKTPVMYSKLSNLVINPPWTVPERLINEDLIPKIKKDPSYIYRNGYTIIDYKGNVIDPYTIDWENITWKKFPYLIRQVPSHSALGNFKFNMPSAEAIFLHDTPVRELFTLKNRALSSGCIRVEKSDELATFLLKEVGWNEEQKLEILENKKTKSVHIPSNNPVYIYYVTTWIENGEMKTLPDIYSYDKEFKLTEADINLVKKYLH